MSSRQLAYVQKRRSTRIYNAISLAIQGSDAFRAPYNEYVSTLSVSCHGCRYRSKYEVIPGDIVNLEVKKSSQDGASYSCKAKVRWVQRLMTKDSDFDIAVELAAPGNIWGILSPPPDWFPIQAPKGMERGSSRREQPLATRIEQQLLPMGTEESGLLSRSGSNDAAAGLPPSLGQVLAGFGKQIEIMVSHAAKSAFAEERERLAGELRTQLQNEAARTLESLLSASKEELTRRMLKDLNDAYEAAARINYERWNKKIEQDAKIAARSIATQAIDISRRVEAMTVNTTALLQRNMEASRAEAVDRFLSRLREQLAPLLKDAQVTLQSLATAENKLRDESEAIRDRFDKFLQQATQNSVAAVQEKTLGMLEQFESDVAKKLGESHDSLHEKSIQVIDQTTKVLRECSEVSDASLEYQLRTLLSSAAENVTKALKESGADFSPLLEPSGK